MLVLVLLLVFLLAFRVHPAADRGGGHGAFGRRGGVGRGRIGHGPNVTLLDHHVLLVFDHHVLLVLLRGHRCCRRLAPLPALRLLRVLAHGENRSSVVGGGRGRHHPGQR